MNAFRTCCHLHLDAGKLRGWHNNNNNYDDDICDDRLLDEFRNNVDDMMKMIDDICRPQILFNIDDWWYLQAPETIYRVAGASDDWAKGEAGIK